MKRGQEWTPIDDIAAVVSGRRANVGPMSNLGFRGSDGTALHASNLGADAAGRVGGRPIVVLIHGGGPDHRSLLPLGRLLSDLAPVVLPDVRGYGRSVCADPTRHTWAQYAGDMAALLHHLGARRAIVGGTGLGSTIALRTAAAHPERVSALVLISVEDIEDDAAKEAEIELMDAFAERVRTGGIEAGWKPILPTLAPVIGALVRDAIPRSDRTASRPRRPSGAIAPSAASTSWRGSPSRRSCSPAWTRAIHPSLPRRSPDSSPGAGWPRSGSPLTSPPQKTSPAPSRRQSATSSWKSSRKKFSRAPQPLDPTRAHET